MHVYLRLASAIGAACLIAGCGGSTPPNVLVIILDTVRADAVGHTIEGVPVTPNVDGIGDAGVTFTRAFAPGPWTVPTHASLFTGLYPHAHGAVHEHFQLDPSLVTMAEHLRDAGYATAGFSCNPWLTAQNGYTQGFDHYEEIFREDTPDKGSALATTRAKRWLLNRLGSDAPFFMFVNYLDAHLPYEPAPEWLARFGPFDGDDDERVFTHEEHGRHMTGEEVLSPEEIRRVVRLYHAGVAYVDDQVGRLLDFLDANALLEDALVIVTSDHGEHLGENGLFGHQFSVMEPLVHVPLIVRFPRTISPGTTRSDFASLIDVLPTILDAVGIRVPDDVHGRTLLTPPAGDDRTLLAEYARPRTLVHDVWQPAHPGADLSRFDMSLRSARLGEWTLTERGDGSSAMHRVDLEDDSAREVADGEVPAEIAAALRAALDQAR